jgi:hypothetical protein
MDNNDSNVAINASEDLSDARLELIRDMDMVETMDYCAKHQDKFQNIHESIMGQYKISNTISEAQLTTMQAFLLEYAPEIKAPEMAHSDSAA